MEILGLLDTLESILLEGFKVPFTKKIMVNEEKILSIIDKMRLVIQGGEGRAKEAIAAKMGVIAGMQEKDEELNAAMEGRPQEESKAVDVLQQAYQMAKEIREGADRYADEVLANLEATSTRILRTVKAGRDRLTKALQGEENK